MQGEINNSNGLGWSQSLYSDGTSQISVWWRSDDGMAMQISMPCPAGTNTRELAADAIFAIRNHLNQVDRRLEALEMELSPGAQIDLPFADTADADLVDLSSVEPASIEAT